MIILLVVAAGLVSAPIVAAVIVTVASLREESAYTLCSRPPGRLEAIARRLLGFQAYGLTDLITPRVRRPRAPMDDDPDAAQSLSKPRS
jgi:hypothetical protein